MSLSEVPASDLKKISLLLDGQLDDAEAEELGQRIDSSKSLREVFIKIAKLHAMLGWCHGTMSRRILQNEVDPVAIAELLVEAEQVAQREADEEADKLAAEEARAAALREEIDRLERRNRQRTEPVSIPRSVLYLGATAIAASLLWLVGVLFQPGTSDIATNEPPPVAEDTKAVEPVATVVATADAKWGDPAIGTEPGTRLLAQELAILEGIAMIRFDDGAEMVLEAPAQLDLLHASRVRLVSGKAVGKVPPAAVGFTVETPTTRIVDLGTEFGVSVGKADVEVHVFDGEVAATAGEASEPNLVTQGRAIRVDSQTQEVSSVEVAPARFVRRLPPIIEFVGSHEGVGEFLRTNTVDKPYDADSDNVYGTAGYYFFNPNGPTGPGVENVTYVNPFDGLVADKPTFVTDKPGFTFGLLAGEGVYSVLGVPDYLDIDDPRPNAGAEVPNMNSGVLSYDTGNEQSGNPQSISPGSYVQLCQIALGEGVPRDGFRIGIFTDNGNIVETAIGGIRLSIEDTQAYIDAESPNLDGDVYLFDVKQALPGDTLLVEVRAINRYSAIGGVLFDLPSTGSATADESE